MSFVVRVCCSFQQTTDSQTVDLRIEVNCRVIPIIYHCLDYLFPFFYLCMVNKLSELEILQYGIK